MTSAFIRLYGPHQCTMTTIRQSKYRADFVWMRNLRHCYSQMASPMNQSKSTKTHHPITMLEYNLARYCKLPTNAIFEFGRYFMYGTTLCTYCKCIWTSYFFKIKDHIWSIFLDLESTAIFTGCRLICTGLASFMSKLFIGTSESLWNLKVFVLLWL
jgi:hypothetical protein